MAPPMLESRIHRIFMVIAALVGVAAAFVAGLFVYVSATTRPIHPDPTATPSVIRAPPPTQWTDAVARGQLIVRRALGEQNLPGLSVAVGTGGEIVWAEGFGYADLEKKTAVTPDTPFRIGNVSNTLTSVAAGLLLEKTRLNLDTDIQVYVPEFPEKQWSITVRQLMGNVAGIRSDAGDEEPLLESCARTVDGLRRFAADRLKFEPETDYRFSSYGWILVSAAIEKVATFYYPRFAGDTRYGPELAREGDHSCFAGGGAFLSTPSDMVRFGLALGGGRLLRPDTLETLQTPQRLSSGRQTDYGLGWNLETVSIRGKPTRMAGHGTKSDFIGGTAYFLTLPERKMVVTITSNTSFADLKSVALNVADAFAEKPKDPSPK